MSKNPATTVSGRTATGPDKGMSAKAGRLIRRADAELVSARLASDPAERFAHAHLAAIRTAAAIVAERGVPRARPPKAVWDQLALAEPELAAWSGYFAQGARVRAAIDAGRFDAVEGARADELLACAEDFRDEVAMRLDPQAGFVQLPMPESLAS